MSSKSPNDDLQKDAETIFRALDGLDQISKTPENTDQKPSFHEIFAYVNNPSHDPSPNLTHALKNDLNVRRDIRKLVSKNNIVDMGMAIAASSGDIFEREAEGFKITLKPSSNQENQSYLLISAIDRDDIPHLLFVDGEDGFYRLEIDDFYEGQAQIIVENDSDIVKALRNPKSHVILS